MLTLSVVALLVSAASLIVAANAYLRAGGRHELASLRREIAQRMRIRYRKVASRAERAQRRLAGLRSQASADLQRRVDAMNRQLAEIKTRAEEGIAHVRTEVSAGSQAAEEELSRRLRSLEAHLQILLARGEMARAEGLAEVGDFGAAEALLDESVTRLREARTRLADELEEEVYFAESIEALQQALRSVRVRAEDHRQQIARVLSKSDALLGSLEAREQALM